MTQKGAWSFLRIKAASAWLPACLRRLWLFTTSEVPNPVLRGWWCIGNQQSSLTHGWLHSKAGGLVRYLNAGRAGLEDLPGPNLRN